MIVHLILGQPVENLSDRDRQELEEGFSHLAGLSCVQSMNYGRDFSGRSRGYEFAAVVHFADQAALDTYMKDPGHLKVVEMFNRLIPERIIIDYHPQD